MDGATYEGPWGRGQLVFPEPRPELAQFRMPRLEELYLFAHHVNGVAIFTLPLPHLRVLQVYHSHDYPLERLAENASLANLTHLLFHQHACEARRRARAGRCRAPRHGGPRHPAYNRMVARVREWPEERWAP